MEEEGFAQRYFIKLISSVIIAGLNIIIQVLLPRVFSVTEYGYYSYNVNVFTAVVTMASLSVPSALISKFSKRNYEIGLVSFYFKFILLVALVLNIGVLFIEITGIANDSFGKQTIEIILLALETSILMRIQTDCVGVFDAMAISKFPALIQVVFKVCTSVLVVFGYLTKNFNLRIFYIEQCILLAFFLFLLIMTIYREQRSRWNDPVKQDSIVYIREYWDFCRPLILYSIFSQVVAVLMNYELMKHGGTTEQAMFGAAWQLNTLVSYVFSPYAELSKREFAIIYNNHEALKHRYVQSLQLMMWVTAFFAIFIAGTSEWVIPMVYGADYMSAKSGTILIMYYTIFQAWGQIAGSFLVATERSKINAFLGMVGQAAIIGLMFLFQIPNKIWPQGLGAFGIALTYLGSVLISVYLSLYINCRILKIKYSKTFSIQILPLVFYTVIIWGLKVFFERAISSSDMPLIFLKILCSGILYTLITVLFIWIKPCVLGTDRHQLKEVGNKLIMRITKRGKK